MIPALIDNVLPEGVHVCSFDEVAPAFGQFQRTGGRIQLTVKLGEFLDEPRRSGIIVAVLIDGSYVTGKHEPNDIDIVVLYRADFDLRQELRPFEYNVLSRRVLRSRFGFDAFIERDGSEGYYGWIDFFSQIRLNDPDQATSRIRKGLLRIDL